MCRDSWKAMLYFVLAAAVLSAHADEPSSVEWNTDWNPVATMAVTNIGPPPKGPTPFNESGISLWLKTRFSKAELEAFQPEDLRVESHFCGCYDKPTPHFPYPVVVFITAKGDLVARMEAREGALNITPLAVRHGNHYCELEVEQHCYGSFAHPCEFTDFRFGRSLAEFFPTCKADAGKPLPDANVSLP
jgi:hypothetical protein